MRGIRYMKIFEIIDEENNVIVAEGKDDIAKKLVRRIENER